MKNSTIRLSSLAIFAAFVTACSSSSGGWEETKSTSARVVIEGVNVNWFVIKALGKHRTGADLALFTFTRTVGTTIKRADLSVSQRAALGKQALAKHPKCKWVGFDPATNQVQSNRLGAVDRILVAPVNC